MLGRKTDELEGQVGANPTAFPASQCWGSHAIAITAAQIASLRLSFTCNSIHAFVFQLLVQYRITEAVQSPPEPAQASRGIGAILGFFFK